MEYYKEFEAAKKVAIQVGGFLKTKEQKNIDSENYRDIKLELDRLSEERIINFLKQDFNYSFLSEEAGIVGSMQSGEPYWIIDPIDGTMNYSRNLPFACVSIALWQDNEPILGVVYDFYRNELFSALVGKGAYFNQQKIISLAPIVKSRAVLATGFPTYMDLSSENILRFINEIKEYKKVRMLGSAALSLCYVACGRVDTYIEEGIKIWDIAAGLALIKVLETDVEIDFLDDFATNIKVGVFS